MTCQLYIEPEAYEAAVLPSVAPVPRSACKRQTLSKRVLTAAAMGLNKACGMRHREAFGILMYHRITALTAGVAEPTWNVTPEAFAAQLEGLLARGFEPWPLRRAIERHQFGRPIPRNVFVVTFDDGYESNYVHAFPILQRLHVPATIFLATAYLDSDQPFPSDDWLAAGAGNVPPHDWQPLSTEQCRAMQASGLVELGAHTHTHADFRGRPGDLHEDLSICQAELKQRFGLQDATFAFPYGTTRMGYAGGELADAAKEAGLLCSLTTDSELVLPPDDPFYWGRFTAEPWDTAASLAGKLSGWYSALRSIGSAVRGCRKCGVRFPGK